MQKNLTGIKKLLTCVAIFCVYLLITVIIFKHRLVNIDSHYGMPEIDSDGTMWYFWARLFTEKNNLNFSLNNLFASYPHGYDVSYIPFFSLVYEITIRLVDILGFGWRHIILVVNTSLVFAYATSAFFTFLLAYYLTRSKLASLISGFIFGFSFYFILMGRGYISQNQLEFIPLYFLSLFYFLDKKNNLALILSSLAFTLLFLVNSYLAFFSLMFSFPILLLYKKEPIGKTVRSTVLYYLAVLSLSFLININFVFQQLYIFSPTLLKTAGKVFVPEKQVVDLLSFFVPSENNLLYRNFGLGNNFLGYTALTIGLSGLFFIKKIGKYAPLLFCFLLSILLASNVPGLFFLNELYFKFFPAFRAVSRLNIFSSLFLSLMAALTVKYFLTKYKKIIVVYVVLALACFLIVLEGLNSDITWKRTTDFSKIAALYEPIRRNLEIRIIAGYPMRLSNGTNGSPPNYEKLGQVVHGKPLVGGLDPFLPQGSEYFNAVKDIEKGETIDVLSKNGVDTIIIYKNLLDNSQKIVANLKKDDRLNYIADYRADYDNSVYVSANDLARNFSVFQIKKVVADNKVRTDVKIAVENLGGASYWYKKDSGVKYSLHLQNLSNRVVVVLDEPYSNKWKMYPDGNNHLGDLPYLFQKEMSGDTHARANVYKNSWTIDPNFIKQKLPKNYYKQNPNGSIDIDLVLYFKPQAYFYLGSIVSVITVGLSLGYLLYTLVWTKFKSTSWK